MPKILINAFSAATGGSLSVSRGLSEQLARDCRDWEFELLCSDSRAAPAHPPDNLRCREMPQARGLPRRMLWEQLSGRAYARRGGFDAWLLLSGFVPFASPLPKVSVWQNAHIWTKPDPSLPASLRRKIAVQKRVMRHSVQRTSLNVFLSEDSLARCGEVMDVPLERSTVIPLGLGDEWLSRGEAPPMADREPLLVMVGDVYAHKGYDLALRALALLHPTHPDLRLAIAGAVVDPADLAHLQQLASTLGVLDRVDFLGKCPQDALIRLYERGLAYVGTSKLETFGLTPLEAMACGLPVVSSRLSACPEVCGDAATYYDPYAPEPLAAAIAGLLGSDAGWRRQQDAGLTRVKRFGWDAVSPRYRLALEALIGIGAR